MHRAVWAKRAAADQAIPLTVQSYSVPSTVLAADYRRSTFPRPQRSRSRECRGSAKVQICVSYINGGLGRFGKGIVRQNRNLFVIIRLKEIGILNEHFG